MLDLRGALWLRKGEGSGVDRLGILILRGSRLETVDGGRKSRKKPEQNADRINPGDWPNSGLSLEF
jgi:hypothetical protein